MKRHTLILTAVMALAAMSCSIQFVNPESPPPSPPPPTMGLDPVNVHPEPQGPDNLPTPNDGIGIPGGGSEKGQILSFTADRTTLNKGECTMLHWETQGQFGARLNGQPVPLMGQQQECPTQTTVYELGLDVGSQMLRREIMITVNGGNQAPQLNNPTKPPKNNLGNPPVITVTSSPSQSKFPTVIGQVANLDLAISNIYPSSTGHIMATVKNTGTVKVSGSYRIECSGNYIDSGGNHPLTLTGLWANVNLTPGKSVDFDTSYSRNPTINEMYVKCTLTPPQGDTNSSNNAMGPTQVK